MSRLLEGEVQRGERSLSFNDQNDADKTINNTTTKREAQRQSAINKVNFPTRQVGKKAT